MKDEKIKIVFVIIFFILLFLIDLYLPYYDKEIILDLRIPRSISIFFTGAFLSSAGYIVQMITRNPLADPFIVGTSSGAMLGIILSILLGVSSSSCGYFFIVISLAFISTYLSIMISRASKIPGNILLSGVAVNSFILSIIVLGVIFSKENSLSFLHISFGSFSYSDWRSIVYSLIAGVFSVLFVFIMMKDIKIIAFHEDKSLTLGINRNRVVFLSLLFSSALSSLSVSLSGIIGFVGLMSPHITRLLFRSLCEEKRLLMSMIVGSSMLFISSITSRLFFYPIEIPPGVFTSIAGSIFFIYLSVVKRAFK